MNTLKKLKSMSSQELEDLMIELRTQIEELCWWGAETDCLNPIQHDARDLIGLDLYLDTDKQLIDYIKKAEKLLLKQRVQSAMLNHTLAK